MEFMKWLLIAFSSSSPESGPQSHLEHKPPPSSLTGREDTEPAGTLGWGALGCLRKAGLGLLLLTPFLLRSGEEGKSGKPHGSGGDQCHGVRASVSRRIFLAGELGGRW